MFPEYVCDRILKIRGAEGFLGLNIPLFIILLLVQIVQI